MITIYYIQILKMTTPERMTKVTGLIKKESDNYNDLIKLYLIVLETYIVDCEHFLKIADLKPTNIREERIKQRKLIKQYGNLMETDSELELIIARMNRIEEYWLLRENKIE